MRISLRSVFVAIVLCVMPVHAGAEDMFFPPDTWNEGTTTWSPEEQADFYEDWFGGQLTAMHEKLLWTEADPVDISLNIRLLFLPTFAPGTMVRVTMFEDGNAKYVFKQLDGAGGFEPGQLVRVIDGELDSSESEILEELINKINPLYGDIPTLADSFPKFCMDGLQTVLEFRDTNNYVVIERHDCDMPPEDLLRKLIRELLDLSGQPVYVSDKIGHKH